MARIARVVVPGHPHHVTQRGCRRQQTFFNAGDYEHYFDFLRSEKGSAEVAVWAYCLMPNHVRLIVVPETEQGLSSFLGPAHWQFALDVNRRMGWKDHLWLINGSVTNDSHLHLANEYHLSPTPLISDPFNPVRDDLAGGCGGYWLEYPCRELPFVYGVRK